MSKFFKFLLTKQLILLSFQSVGINGDSFILEAQSSNICSQQISIIGDNFILESLICLSNGFDVEIEC